MLDHALAYAARGWFVFPLVPGGKEPMIPRDRGGNGYHDATVDVDRIRAWWTAAPDAGIGIATAPSGIGVLDVDIGEKNGKPVGGAESLRKLVNTIKIPQTLAARAGGGGLHVYLTRPPDADPVRRIRFNKVDYPGLDWIGDGYIIAPPSLHPSGARYTWANDAPIVEAPAELLRIVGTTAPKVSQVTPYTGGTPASPELLEHIRKVVLPAHGPSIKGQGGNKHAYRLGAILFGGYDLTHVDAMRLALEWNAMYPENTWAPERLAVPLLNGAAYGQGVRGEKRIVFEAGRQLGLVDDPFAKTATVVTVAAKASAASAASGDADFGAEILKASKDLADYRNGGSTSDEVRPLFKQARDLLTQDFPPTPWIIRGLLQESAMGIIGGEPKSNKTWAAIEWVVAIASNTKCFGQFPVIKQGKVALFLAEDAERAARNRLVATCHSRGIAPADVLGNIAYVCRHPMNLADDVELSILIASIRRIKPILAIIDPLRDVHRVNEDSATDMADILARLRAVRDLTDASIAITHHSAKASKDSGNRRGGQKLRGSSAIHGALDFGFYILDVDADQNEWRTTIETEIRAGQSAGMFSLTLNVTDDKNGEATDAKWTYSPAVTQKDEGKPAFKKDEDRVLDAMVEIGKPTTVSDLRVAARMNKARVCALVEALAESGEIVYTENRLIALDPAVMTARRAEMAAKASRSVGDTKKGPI
jgi:hypothetical protein